MILIADDLWRKSHASDWEEVRPLQRVLKMKIDGTPRNRETTLESAVWQATSRKAREKWRTPASRVIPKTRRIEAISPRIRKGSVTRTWERMDIRTVCRISTSISTMRSWFNTLRVWAATVQ